MAFNLGGRWKVGGVNLGFNIPFGTDKRAKLGDSKKYPAPTKTPGNSINRMMANVRQSDLFSRPYLYSVIISPPALLYPAYSMPQLQNMMLNCSSVNIPGFVMATKEHKTYGLKREYVYEKLVNACSMEFYLSDQMFEYNFFRDWMEQMNPQDLGWIQYPIEYQSTMTIYQLSRMEKGTDSADDIYDRTFLDDLRVMMQVKLVDAYPKSLSDLQLGHETAGSIQKITTDIMYRKATVTDFLKKSQKERAGGILSESFGAMNDSIKEIGTSLQEPLAQLNLPKFGPIIKKQNAVLPNMFEGFNIG